MRGRAGSRPDTATEEKGDSGEAEEGPLGQQDGAWGPAAGVSSSSTQPDTPASWGPGLRSWGRGRGTAQAPSQRSEHKGCVSVISPSWGPSVGLLTEEVLGKCLRWKGGRWLAGCVQRGVAGWVGNRQMVDEQAHGRMDGQINGWMREQVDTFSWMILQLGKWVEGRTASHK